MNSDGFSEIKRVKNRLKIPYRLFSYKIQKRERWRARRRRSEDGTRQKEQSQHRPPRRPSSITQRKREHLLVLLLVFLLEGLHVLRDVAAEDALLVEVRVVLALLLGCQP